MHPSPPTHPIHFIRAETPATSHRHLSSQLAQINYGAPSTEISTNCKLDDPQRGRTLGLRQCLRSCQESACISIFTAMRICLQHKKLYVARASLCKPFIRCVRLCAFWPRFYIKQITFVHCDQQRTTSSTKYIQHRRSEIALLTLVCSQFSIFFGFPLSSCLCPRRWVVGWNVNRANIMVIYDGTNRSTRRVQKRTTLANVRVYVLCQPNELFCLRFDTHAECSRIFMAHPFQNVRQKNCITWWLILWIRKFSLFMSGNTGSSSLSGLTVKNHWIEFIRGTQLINAYEVFTIFWLHQQHSIITNIQHVFNSS